MPQNARTLADRAPTGGGRRYHGGQAIAKKRSRADGRSPRGAVRRALRARGLTARGLAARAAYTLLPRLGYEVGNVTPGAVLVTRTVVASRHWMEQETAISDQLAHTQVAGMLRLYGVNCVIDVGAHKGQYAKRLRRSGYRGHIVSFEPVPHAFRRLERASARDRKWTVHQLALGREDGATTMQEDRGTLSSLLPATEFGAGRYPRLQETRSVEVQVRRLDDLLDAVIGHVANPRPFLKLDTQGYDVEVFAGLGERAEDVVGLQSEVALMPIYAGMPRMCEALGIYEAAGFEVAGLYPVTRQSATARMVEYDCVMLRASALGEPGGDSG